MKCLNCGKGSSTWLCDDCRSEAILDKVFRQVMWYKSEDPNLLPAVKTYVESFENQHDARIIVPEILGLFDPAVTEYYFCRFHRYDPEYETLAISYIEGHDLQEYRTQEILNGLLESVNVNEKVSQTLMKF